MNLKDTHAVASHDLTTLVFCTFRYALGRVSPVVSEAVALVRKYEESLTASDKIQMRKEIRDAIKGGRAGHKCDIEEWDDLVTWLSVRIPEGLFVPGTCGPGREWHG